MIQVSVIIPTYNRSEKLRAALQSVLSQTGVSFEVIVVDDGSTDNTDDVVKQEFPSVFYLRQENKGVSSARNAGLQIAKGTWIAFLDSDDEWLPGKLKAQLDFFESHPDFKIVQTEEIWIRNGVRVNPMKKHQKFSGWIFEKCLPLCLISPSAVMIHRSTFEDVGVFDESYPACEDYELWLRITCQYQVGLIPKAYIKKFGGHEDQLSHKYEAMDQFRIRALEKILTSNKLSASQTQAAQAMLDEKKRIFDLGAAKRGKSPLPEINVLSQPAIPLMENLDQESKNILDQLQKKFTWTYQELRELAVIAKDLEMWQEKILGSWIDQAEAQTPSHLDPVQKKNTLLRSIKTRYEEMKNSPKVYPEKSLKPIRDPLRPTLQNTDKKIHGDCPVASPETVCCNLRTIDAVENCTFGCSYCTIQTFYGEEAVFDSRLAEKLDQIPLDPNRHYHYGTGQSSDSLVWGNKNGNLDALCAFAKKNANVLLEFKTKSDNISYFLEHEIPRNIVISWSLNPPIVIENEEHFTASLDRRLAAARKVADRGIKIAFHFHPIIYYEGWKTDYPELTKRIQTLFKPEEILFISFGSVTFIKPVMQAIRKRGEPSRILQMQLVKAPHNKWTYPPELKTEMFQTLWQSFKDWQSQVFFYLCMEEAKFWDATFGWHYSTNELFESDFSQKCFEKIRKSAEAAGVIKK